MTYITPISKSYFNMQSECVPEIIQCQMRFHLNGWYPHHPRTSWSEAPENPRNSSPCRPLICLYIALMSTSFRADEAKVKAITELEPPSCLSDRRIMLGTIHYLGRHSLNRCEFTKPLSNLLKHDVSGFRVQCKKKPSSRWNSSSHNHPYEKYMIWVSPAWKKFIAAVNYN